MKKTLYLTIALIIILPTITKAHPGRTDSSGCHTCRTNCANWGLSTGEYHCHNAKTIPQPETPIKSTYGENGKGYTEPAPEYENKNIIIEKPTQIKENNTTLEEKTNNNIKEIKPNCVTNSTYDEVQKKCFCNIGYMVENGKCVDGKDYCRNKIGIYSHFNNNKCYCDAGYKLNNSVCIKKKTFIEILKGIFN